MPLAWFWPPFGRGASCGFTRLVGCAPRRANMLRVLCAPPTCASRHFAPLPKHRQVETSICKIRLLCLSDFWTCTAVQWTDTQGLPNSGSLVEETRPCLHPFCQQWALLSANLSGCCEVTERLFERLDVRAIGRHAWLYVPCLQPTIGNFSGRGKLVSVGDHRV